MDINFARELKTLDGGAVAGPNGRMITTLKDITIDCLLAVFQDESNLPGQEKLNRYELALKINKTPIVELTAEEVSMIKKLIAKAYGPLIVGQAWMMLEGKDGGLHNNPDR